MAKDPGGDGLPPVVYNDEEIQALAQRRLDKEIYNRNTTPNAPQLDPKAYVVGAMVELRPGALDADTQSLAARIADIANSRLQDQTVAMVIPIKLGENQFASMAVGKDPSGKINILYQDSTGAGLENSAVLNDALTKNLNTPVSVVEIKAQQAEDQAKRGVFAVENMAIMAELSTREQVSATTVKSILEVQNTPDDISKSHQLLLREHEYDQSFKKQIGNNTTYTDIGDTVGDILRHEEISLELKKKLLREVLSDKVKITSDQLEPFKSGLQFYIKEEQQKGSEKVKSDIKALDQDIENLIKSAESRAVADIEPPSAVEIPKTPDPLEPPKAPSPPKMVITPSAEALKTRERSPLSPPPVPEVPPPSGIHVPPVSVSPPPSKPVLSNITPPVAASVAAVDGIMIGGPAPKGVAKARTQEKDADQILKQIRENVLEKQRQFALECIPETGNDKELQALRDKLAKAKNDEISVLLAKEEVRTYVESSIKEEPVKQVAWAELRAGETKAYNDILSPKNGFKTINWEGRDTEKIVQDDRTIVTKPISNAAGDKLFDLKETTITGNLSIDGKEVKNYRTIDFPKETNGGPVHLAMAAKDINGNNVSADKGLYFTAHYDEAGKLVDRSYPQPIKFSGTGPDAVACWTDAEGQPYTLGVTKAKFDEMTKQLEQNKGMEAELDKGKTQDVIGVDPNLKQEGKVVQKDQPDNAPVTPPVSENAKKTPEVVDNSKKSVKNQLQGQAGKNQDPAQNVEIPESVNVGRAIQLFNDAQKGSPSPKNNSKPPPGGHNPNGPKKVPGGHGQKGYSRE